MDILIIAVAFFSGFAAQHSRLPPMIGFLAAGFALQWWGYEAPSLLNSLSDLGITLLLFSIGLKLDVRLLLGREVWLGATLHNLFSTLAFMLVLVLLQALGVSMLAGMGLGQIALLGFSLSFSSTVFAVKVLQDKGELSSTYGSLAIGILVMQDILAVLFLSATTGKLPHWYAIFLFLLPFCRPLFYHFLDRSGHGELLILSGVFFALVVGAGLFGFAGIKPDLGALITGMLLAGHSKASELSKSLFNMKELFLICFFLSIGLTAQPGPEALTLGVLLLALLPLKTILYFLVIDRFHFRLRTSVLASLTLTNFSEFGLIVSGLAYRLGWMNGEMLVAVAIAVSLSFILAAPLNRFGDYIYMRSRRLIREVPAVALHQRDRLIDPGDARIIVLGMGRIGTGAYDEMQQRFGDIILGVEITEDAADHHQRHNRRVIKGDATDPDFWERMVETREVELVLLAMPHHKANQFALEQLQRRGFSGRIAAIAEYPDQVAELLDRGVDAAFNIYREAGSGFAAHVCDHLQPAFPARTVSAGESGH